MRAESGAEVWQIRIISESIMICLPILHKHDIDVGILHFDMLWQLKKDKDEITLILNLFTCHISTCLMPGLPQILCQRSWVKRVSVDMFGRLRRALRLVELLMFQKSQTTIWHVWNPVNNGINYHINCCWHWIFVHQPHVWSFLISLWPPPPPKKKKNKRQRRLKRRTHQLHPDFNYQNNWQPWNKHRS